MNPRALIFDFDGVIGLIAGAHIRPGQAGRLGEAGAMAVAATWSEVASLLDRMG